MNAGSELVGRTFQHYKGGTYYVVSVSMNEETLEPLVNYIGFQSSREFPAGTMWTRKLSVWNESVVHNGKFVPRFKPL